MIYHVNKLKHKKKSNYFNRCEKVFGKIQHPFIIKDLQKGDIKGTYLDRIKTIYGKPMGFPGGSVGKSLPADARHVGKIL